MPSSGAGERSQRGCTSTVTRTGRTASTGGGRVHERATGPALNLLQGQPGASPARPRRISGGYDPPSHAFRAPLA
jgi:hypothetical protein